MPTYARTIDLRDEPGVIERYDAYHREAWPEVEQGLLAIGIERMRIWRLGRRLFMLMETAEGFEPERDFARYLAKGGRIAEWQAMMDSFQQPVPDARPGEWWADMHLVFDLRA